MKTSKIQQNKTENRMKILKLQKILLQKNFKQHSPKN
jgi:hypothetical protein